MSKSGKEKPFLFLFTGDEFLRRTKIDSLLEQFIPASLKLTNLTRIHGFDVDFSAVLSQAGTPSLMGGAQVFWISQADEIKKSEWASFERYCTHPAPQSYFIFEADELEKAHPLLKLAGRYGVHTDFKKYGRASLAGMEVFRAKLKKAGKKLTPGAWELLEERLGGSLRFMDLALDQLILYSENAEIDETQVRNLTKAFLQYDPFDLTDALIRGNVSEALKIFNFFHELSDDLTQITGLIHWQLKRVWQAKRIAAQGGREGEVAKALRIPSFRVVQFLKQIERFDTKRIEELLYLLWEFDWNSKKGTVDQTAMETFLVNVGVL